MRHGGSMFKRLNRNTCCALGIVAVVAVGALVTNAGARDGRYGYARDATAFDGPRSVVIQSDSGPCEGSFRYGVEIVDGAVTYQGTPYSRVMPNGTVRVRLSMGDQHAEGVGRLSRGAGSGVWRGVGQSGMCTGRWFAQRRDETFGAGR